MAGGAGLPISWTQGPARTLQQYVPLVQALPAGKTVYMQECVDDLGPRGYRLSDGVCSAAQMDFWMNADAFDDPQLMPIVTKSILGGLWGGDGGVANGGFYDGDGVKHEPMKHPIMKSIHAKDIISVVPVSPYETPDIQIPQNYRVCRVTISFETLPYETTPSRRNDYNTSWMSVFTRATNQRVSIPLGWYEFRDGVFANFPALGGQYLTQPTGMVELMIYQSSHTDVFGFLLPDGWKVRGYSDFGNVNSMNWANYNAQELLLDNIEVRPYQDWLGVRQYDVRVILLYNGWGWNNGITPGGDIRPLRFVAGGRSPFNIFGLPNLLLGLNPLGV